MAFLCPVRIRNNNRKSKKKKGDIIPSLSTQESLSEKKSESQQIGRITGSSSIETLVRIGNDKNSSKGQLSDQQLQRMIVLHDFTPCVDDELEVHRGDIVSLLYREHDWAYVILSSFESNNEQDVKEGFIPFSYLNNYEEEEDTQDDSNSNVNHFYKDPFGPEYIVLYSFKARDENDMSVERGEQITVLNKDDPDWFWVQRKHNNTDDLDEEEEGFVPSAFVFPINFINKKSEEESNSSSIGQLQEQPQVQQQQEQGTELVMLYDYKAQAPDDLSVRRGDWVYADMNHQTVEGWLWAFAPKQKKYGFIPKAYARPPAMTSL